MYANEGSPKPGHPQKVGLISSGCPKNLVDSDVMKFRSGALRPVGFVEFAA